MSTELAVQNQIIFSRMLIGVWHAAMQRLLQITSAEVWLFEYLFVRCHLGLGILIELMVCPNHFKK